MSFRRLIFRNLVHFWRTNLAVVAGVATAVAVLAGALLVGESVRDSLRSILHQRLGTTEYLISADRFFSTELARAFTSAREANHSMESCPIIYLQGVVTHDGTGRRANNVNVYGIDDRFWKFQGRKDRKTPEGRAALIGAALAQRLGVSPGEGLLLRLETQQGIPRESLYGRREDAGRTVRLVCDEIIPAGDLGEFALRSGQGTIYSMFVPLQRLQRDLAQPSGANAILLASKSPGADLQVIRRMLKDNFTLQDVGVRLRPLPSRTGIAVESTRILLENSIGQAALAAAAEAGLRASGIFAYLANSIRIGGREIPYSVITAADLRQGAMRSIHGIGDFPERPVPADANESIWLNEWAWRDLGGSPGEVVEVDYYLWQEDGQLVTRTARFQLSGVISISGDVDAALAPTFPGITEARSMTEWDPPFPLDLSRIRPKDEEYWDRYKATPKAFITLTRGQILWQSRFGKLTAVRISRDPGTQDASSSGDRLLSTYPSQKMPNVPPDLDNLAERLRKRIDPESAGFAVTAVKKDGLEASRGSTDFGEYFTYFSFFLIAAAILLSALFFRLGVEQRVREIGTLQALGFPMQKLRLLFLLEGGILSVGGSLLGLLGAIGYGGTLLFGLRTWWVGAVGTRNLHLHISWAGLGLGATVGIIASLGVIAWTIRDLGRNSPRALLAGVLEERWVRRRRARSLGAVSSLAFLAAAAILLGSTFRKIPDVEGFFGGGFLLLVSLLSLTALQLRRNHPRPLSGHGFTALFRLGARNATHRPGRSILCIALIASATFVIVSLEVFRRDPGSTSLEPASGTGGYPLMAESALPIVYDLNSAAGREALGIPESEVPELAPIRFVPFRIRPGDDASCLNLYAPQEPKILGASHSFLTAKRFSFQESLASSQAEKRNPWLLLESPPRDGVIPAIGDANTIQYILHLAMGSELTVRGISGSPVRLRLVAALRDSILQGELIISETNFLRLFPGQEGYRFFLLEVAPGIAAQLVQPLMERLSDWGFNVESSRERLAAYHRVENTYLSTFQALGALGLILGTVGLAAILLRNVLERRQELALLRAVGYRSQYLSAIVVAENVLLMTSGLACGTTCALVAVLPALHARGNPFPVAMVSVILLAVFLVGIVSSLIAVIAAFRSPLLDALKSD